MTVKDQAKVIKAGFTIIRCDDYPQIRIKIKTGSHEFKTHETYLTKAARERTFNKMLEDPFTISD